MSLLAKAGSITTPTGTGNQSYTGVGFQPTFVFFISGLTTTIGIKSSARFCYGWSAGAGKDVAFYGFGVDTSANADTGRSHRRDFCIYRCSTALATADQASLVSFDADGFTLNWGAINATSTTVGYLALGGDAVAFAGAGPTVPAVGASVSVTGTGFQPQAILLGHTGSGITPSANANDMINGFGAATGTSDTGAIGMASDDGAGTMVTRSNYQSDAIAVGPTFTGVDFEAALQSLDADGFTLSVSDNPTADSPTSYAALRGVQMKAGSTTKRTSAGTQSVTGIGFQPKAGIFWTVYWNGDHADALGCIGVSDGTNEFTVGYGDRDGGSTSVVKGYWSATKAIATLDSTPDIAGEADVQSWDSDGFTLNWTTADAQASGLGYIVFGDIMGASAFYLTTL